MINYLKNCQKTTLIGQLPDIINSNNQAIKDEFDWIFDSSLNRLKQSVYAPTGSVKSYLGEFVNLSCEYLTIKNIDSLENTIHRAVENIIDESFISDVSNVSIVAIRNHNLLDNRFSSSTYEECIQTNYAHDAERIYYRYNNDSYESVADVLSNIEPIVNRVDTTVNNAITNVSDYLISIINDTSAQINTSIMDIMNNTSIGYLVSFIDNVSTSLNNNINNVSTRVNNINTQLSGRINQLNTNLYTEIGSINESIERLKKDFQIWNLILDYNDGITPKKIVLVMNGQPFGSEKLDTPTRQGYTFKNWTDINGVEYDQNTIVNLSEDLELFANWSED